MKSTPDNSPQPTNLLNALDLRPVNPINKLH